MIDTSIHLGYTLIAAYCITFEINLTGDRTSQYYSYNSTLNVHLFELNNKYCNDRVRSSNSKKYSSLPIGLTFWCLI